MLDLAIGLMFLAAFVVLLVLVRARNGEARIKSVWAAQGISLVCVVMIAGGFFFKTLLN